MAGLKIFFNAFKYLTQCVEDSLKFIDKERLRTIFSILIETRRNKNKIIVDGQGRSLQSMLILEDCLEHNGFPIILPANNANLRPWKRGDIFFFNSGSGSGSTLKHAQLAEKDGLIVLGMTYNNEIHEEFQTPSEGILYLKPSSGNSIFAPLGTEFELTSAVIGSTIGYSISETPEIALSKFEKSTQGIVELYKKTYDYLQDNMDSLMKFAGLVSEYIPVENTKKIYFCGVGRDAIINQVAAIRYGHLQKMSGDIIEKDLRVIYEGHWDLREAGDLAIITSGSGSTSQTLDYALQGFIHGMKIFGITSFEDSDLGRFTKRVNGCLVIPGRDDGKSYFNMPSKRRVSYLPKFELNCYITLDSILSLIAAEHGITEKDMSQSHRMKILE